MHAELPEEIDVVVVGSGAAALTGAVTAAAAGLSTIIIEKGDKWGGTSAYSGGGFWIPNNPIMRAAGIDDSLDAATTYFNACVGDVGPATSPERRIAYLEHGPRMVQFLADQGYRFNQGGPVPDYYPQRPCSSRGRSLSGQGFDGKELGEMLPTLRRSLNYPPLVFTSYDMPALLAPFRKPGNLLRIGRVLARTLWWKVRGKVPLSMGLGTVGNLMRIIQRQKTPLFLNTGMTGLTVENGRATAVEVDQAGTAKTIRARRAILIAAGGFAQNAEFRRQYQPVGSAYTATAPEDTGLPIQAAMKAGAAVSLMEESWWMPVVKLPGGSPSILLWERSYPHSIIVDHQGQRFMNEAQPYNDAGRIILEHDKIVPSMPAWMIIDARHRRHYAFTNIPASYTPKAFFDEGVFTRAAGLRELAQKIGIDADGLEATVRRFNGFAVKGEDEDFGRGGNSYDNAWGDQTVKPNPNLGSIEQAPFYAIPIWPGDIGTKGGLLTDDKGQVVNEEGRRIAGLYAAGNSTASVMGRSYPGAGGTLGPAMTFAYIGMRHAAGLPEGG